MYCSYTVIKQRMIQYFAVFHSIKRSRKFKVLFATPSLISVGAAMHGWVQENIYWKYESHLTM